ncbi:MAG TPA: AMP-binding protein [Casimicrobiaceae bacterium]|nr:AMP-binding protein [Casimicrobiaceae bacterium]
MPAGGHRSALGLEHADTVLRMWRNTHADPETLRQFQLRKLRLLLAHCRTHVAAYREHWRPSKLGPADIERVGHIEALPTIAKNDLRGRPLAETLVDGADVQRLVRHTTSGSSGQPFNIYRAPREEHLLNLFRLRASAEAGLRTFDRVARFSQLPLDEYPRPWAGRIRQAIGIHRERRFDALAPAKKLAENLIRHRPDVIYGYPSTLRHVAARIDDEPRRIRPRLIFCGGEVLDAASRRMIESAFAAPVVDFYGAHEFNLLAWQCPKGDGYHVCDDNVLVEIVGDDGRAVGPGEVGEVVATALHSYTMPFVRYRTGDLAIRGAESCGCGQPFSALRAIQGRRVDYLRLPEGRRVHPYAITVHLAEREAAWVAQHQIVQTADGRIRLDIRPSGTPRSEDIERVHRMVRGILGGDTQFDLALVERFPPHPSGKFQPYISLVEPSRADELSAPDLAARPRGL